MMQRASDACHEVDREYFETDDRINALGKHTRDCLQTQDEQCSEHDLQATLDEWMRWNSSPEYKWKGLNTILLSTWEAGATKAMSMAIHAAYRFLQEHEWLHKKGEWQQTAEYFYGLHEPKLPNQTLSQLAQIAGSWVVLDVETTGFSPNSERIIRIEALRFELGKAVAAFSTFVNPGIEISHEVETITGISNAEVLAAKPFTTAFEELKAFLAKSIVVAHNAEFGLQFLAAECTRNNLPTPTFDALCTYELAQSTFPHIRKSLDSLINHLNIDTRQFNAVPSDMDCSATFWRDAHVVGYLLGYNS
jgi:inhibitor of KinA sporulation pathway (predicted exonuclease)